jgi:hypothetical protein
MRDRRNFRHKRGLSSSLEALWFSSNYTDPDVIHSLQGASYGDFDYENF